MNQTASQVHEFALVLRWSTTAVVAVMAFGLAYIDQKKFLLSLGSGVIFGFATFAVYPMAYIIVSTFAIVALSSVPGLFSLRSAHIIVPSFIFVSTLAVLLIISLTLLTLVLKALRRIRRV